MEKISIPFGYKKKMFHDVKEVMLSTELNLPDYYPDICRIVSCRVMPCVDNKQKQEDHLQVDGIGTVRLLYAAEDKSFHCFETSVRYSKDTKYTNAEEQDLFFVSQSIENVNYRAIGPRRVDVKAYIAVTFDVLRICNLPNVCEDDSCVEKLLTEKEIIGIKTASCVSLVIDEDFVTNDERFKNSKIIQESIEIFCNEYKTVTDKILIKGSIECSFLCLQNNSNILFKCSESVPFSQVAEVYGLHENDICELDFHLHKHTFNCSESGECNICLYADCGVTSSKTEIVQLTNDLYSISNDVHVTYRHEELQVANRPFSEIITTSLELGHEIDPMSQIVAAFCSALNEKHTFADGELRVSGSADITVVIQHDDDCQCISRTIPIDLVKTYTDISKAVPVLYLRCKNISCMKMSDVWTIHMDLNCVGSLEITDTVTYVGAYEVDSDTSQDQSYDRISIYFAESGENIWSIAKENKVAYKAVKEQNGIESDLLPVAKTLILIR